MKCLISLCIMLLICICQINAQLLEKSKDGYRLNSTEYTNENDILNLLQTVPEAKNAYEKSIKEGKRAKKLGVFSLFCMGATVFFGSQIANPEGDSPNHEFLLLAFGTTAVAMITGTAGIIYKVKSSHSKNSKVIDYYNSEQIGFLPRDYNKNLSLQLGGNGLGLVLSF